MIAGGLPEREGAGEPHVPPWAPGHPVLWALCLGRRPLTEPPSRSRHNAARPKLGRPGPRLARGRGHRRGLQTRRRRRRRPGPPDQDEGPTGDRDRTQGLGKLGRVGRAGPEPGTVRACGPRGGRPAPAGSRHRHSRQRRGRAPGATRGVGDGSAGSRPRTCAEVQSGSTRVPAAASSGRAAAYLPGARASRRPPPGRERGREGRGGAGRRRWRACARGGAVPEAGRRAAARARKPPQAKCLKGVAYLPRCLWHVGTRCREPRGKRCPRHAPGHREPSVNSEPGEAKPSAWGPE